LHAPPLILAINASEVEHVLETVASASALFKTATNNASTDFSCNALVNSCLA
jgi:hypothetical protein